MKTYSFEGLTSPEIVLPADIKTMAFVDRSLISHHGLTPWINDYGKFGVDSVSHNKLIVNSCYQTLQKQMTKNFGLKGLPLHSISENKLNGSHGLLEWTAVDSICSLNHSDVLITLEDIRIMLDYYQHAVDDESYIGGADIKYFAIWRIYDPLNKTYRDERILADTLFLEQKFSNCDELLKKMPKRNVILKDIGSVIGNRYATLLAPTWKNLERKYFISGHKKMIVADYYIQKDEFGKANQLWSELAKSDDAKLAGRACYNLAFLSELEGNMNDANDWIVKSIKCYRRENIKNAEYAKVKKYYKQLILRTQNNILLAKYFGQ